jgi:hypothetical protein
MVSERHAIECDDFEFLPVQLKIYVAVGGGVDNAPELTLTGVNVNRRANFTVHREDSIYFFKLASAGRSLRFNAT